MGPVPLVKILVRGSGRWARFPLLCNYQRCGVPITAYPLVRRIACGQHKTKYYHVGCAELLRVI